MKLWVKYFQQWSRYFGGIVTMTHSLYFFWTHHLTHLSGLLVHLIRQQWHLLWPQLLSLQTFLQIAGKCLHCLWHILPISLIEHFLNFFPFLARTLSHFECSLSIRCLTHLSQHFLVLTIWTQWVIHFLNFWLVKTFAHFLTRTGGNLLK